jgi:cation:H+ antiporter
MIGNIPASLIIDIPLVFIVMGIMTIPTIIKGKLSRWQGISLLCIYAAFIASQAILGFAG